jgi:hypothetical protein
LGVGYGTAELYRKRLMVALNSLADEYIKWPDATEQLLISQDIQKEFDFPHCVGIADGTLFPLAFEPQTADAPDYSGRKNGYSLTTMIVCDHNLREELDITWQDFLEVPMTTEYSRQQPLPKNPKLILMECNISLEIQLWRISGSWCLLSRRPRTSRYQKSKNSSTRS